MDSYLTLLDAQRTLYTAQQALIAAQQTAYDNQATLYKVLGGGVTAERQGMASSPTRRRSAANRRPRAPGIWLRAVFYGKCKETENPAGGQNSPR